MDFRLYQKSMAVVFLTTFLILLISNGLTFCICLRKKLRKIPLFVFTAFMVPFDSFAILNTIIGRFSLDYFSYEAITANELFCRIANLLRNGAFHSAVWLLVAMSIERCLSVKLLQWRKNLFNSKKASIVSVIVIFISFAINFHLTFSTVYSEYSTINNQTNETTVLHVCKFLPISYSTSMVHIYTYSVIPFLILFSSNCVLIQQIMSEKKSRVKTSEKDKAKKIALSKALIITSFLLALLTLPLVIVQQFGPLFGPVTISQTFRILTDTCGLLLYFYHGSHFFVLIITNKAFRKQAKIFISTKKKSKDSNSIGYQLNWFKISMK